MTAYTPHLVYQGRRDKPSKEGGRVQRDVSIDKLESERDALRSWETSEDYEGAKYQHAHDASKLGLRRGGQEHLMRWVVSRV